MNTASDITVEEIRAALKSDMAKDLIDEGLDTASAFKSADRELCDLTDDQCVIAYQARRLDEERLWWLYTYSFQDLSNLERLRYLQSLSPEEIDIEYAQHQLENSTSSVDKA